MADVEQIKALVAQVTGESRPRRRNEDWRDWRFGVQQDGERVRGQLIDIGAPTVPYLIEKFSDNFVREVLYLMGDPAVEPVIAVFTGADDRAKSSVIDVLKGSHSTLPLVNDTLQQFATDLSLPSKLRFEATLALAKRRDPRALDLLITWLDETAEGLRTQPSPEGRAYSENKEYRDLHSRLCSIFNIFDWYREPRAVPYIIPFLKWKDFESVPARGRAAFALGKIGDARAVDPLLTALKWETDRMTKIRMAEAVCSLGEPRVIPEVERLASDLLSVPAIKKPLDKLRSSIEDSDES